MSDTTTMICNDGCDLHINIEEIEKIYDALSAKIYIDMDKQYREGKISGPKYADTWKDIMAAVINNAISGVVALQGKETTADRAVKYESIDSSQSKTERDDELADENIDSSQAKTERDDELADKEIEVKQEQIDASEVKSNNETALATTKQLVDIANEELINANEELTKAKEKAEDIKNGDDPGAGSLYEKNIAVLGAQELLYDRQKTGFDDNARQKILNSQISAWSITYKDGALITVPDGVMKNAIDASIDSTNENLGKSHPATPPDITPPAPII